MSESRSLDRLAKIIDEYLIRNHVFEENCPWEIRESPLGGFGVFAKRDIEAGDLIFKDLPVILGPRCLDVPLECCSYCYTESEVKFCDRNCGLLICASCDIQTKHHGECKLILEFKTDVDLVEKSTTITKCLAPLRSLLLGEKDKEVVRNLKSHRGGQNGREIDVLTEDLRFEVAEKDQKYMRFVCSVMDANAFEVVVVKGQAQTSLRGLYPLGSLTNHSCSPNAFHVFDGERRMVARASVPIAEGSEIFDTYSRLIWATATRSNHLRKTKHFVCECNRCLDPTEFGSYLSSTLCACCGGHVVPSEPLRSRRWRCERCGQRVPLEDVARVFSLIGDVVRCFDDEQDFRLMDAFLRGKMAALVPKTSTVVVEVKYRIVWILGRRQRFLWRDLPMELLILKKEYCDDILEILEKLNLGLCKMRGLLLYEIYRCLVEIKQRKNNNEDGDEDYSRYLNEAAEILRYDVTAPDIIKQQWLT